MQYREQGDRIQVLAYRGYNKEKKRAEVKMLGSYNRYSFKTTDGLLEAMTDDEKKDFTVHIENERLSSEVTSRLYNFKQTYSKILYAYDCIKNHGMTFDASKVTAADAEAIHSAMKAMTKALEDAGHLAPKRPYKAKTAKVVENKQLPLN